MARGLGLTALRVALGGLSGVGQDRAAMREAQRVEQEQARALERQRMLDERQNEATRLARELSVRSEQRQALDAGGLMADMDMPGATPRTGVMRQTIGGQEFLFEPKDTREHREAVRKRREQGAQPDRLQWSDKYGSFINLTTGKVMPASGLPSTGRAAGMGAPTGRATASAQKEEDRAEGIWNSLTNRPDDQLTPEEISFRNTMVNTFRSLRKFDTKTGAVRGSTAPARRLILQSVLAAEQQEELRRRNRPKVDAYEAMVGEQMGGRGASPARQPTAQQPARQAPQPQGMTADQEAEIARQMREEGYDDASIAQYLEDLRNEYQ